MALARDVGARLVATAWLVVGVLAPLAAQTPGPAAPPLTLDAAIAEALERSPVLAPRDDAVTTANIRRSVAASEFGTKITPSIMAATDPIAGDTRSAGVTVTKKLSTGGQVFVNALTYSFGDSAAAVRGGQYSLGISQPLLGGFWRTATADLVDAARAGVSAARALGAARGALIVDVTRHYVAVIRAQRVVAAADAAASRAAALKTASEARTSVGLATRLDVLRAELQESHLAAAVARAKTAVESAEDDLAMILGRPLGSPVAVDDFDPAAIERRLAPLPATLDDLVTLALADRLDVIEARDRVADAVRAADIAHWNLAPPVSLDLSYTQRGLGLPGTASFGLLTGGWHVGLSTTYAIDRAAGAAVVGMAHVASGAAERAAHDAEQQAEADVRRTYRAWQAAIATVDTERASVGLAQRERALAEMRLERGLSDTLDVVAAEDSLLEAQTALIGAELDRTVLAVDLRRAVGVLNERGWPR